MRSVTVQQALDYVARHPEPSSDVALDVPVHEMICRALFEVANSPDVRVRGSMTRATKAQRMIMDRLVGTRRPGSHPAAQRDTGIEFVDLAAGELE